MKRIIFFFILLSALLLASPAVYAISAGEYVSVGSYSGQPLLWRCVSVSENGAYLVSDKNILKMPFDTAGERANDANGYRALYGSNSWETSSVRAFLNGDFLDSFSVWELGAVSETKIRSAASYSDTLSVVTEHIYNDDLKSSVQNFSQAFTVETQDKLFLPSVAELQPLYGDIATFGADYYMGQDGMGNYEKYFLRDAVSYTSDNSLVRCVVPEIDIRYDGASMTYSDKLIRAVNANNENVGIRPALYLKINAPLTGGDGSRRSPYRLVEGAYCSIEYKPGAAVIGNKFTPVVKAGGIDGGYSVKYYCNSVKYNAGEPCCVYRTHNELYAVACDMNGNTVCSSDTIYVDGISALSEYDYLNENFESAAPFYSQFLTYGIVSGDTLQKINIGGTHGNVLSVSARNASTFLNSKKLDAERSTFTVQTDFLLQDFNFIYRPIFYVCYYNSNGKQWLNPVVVYPDGTVYLSGTNKSGVVKSGISLNEWHNIMLTFHYDKGSISLAVDGEIVVHDAELIAPYDYFSYINIAYTSSGNPSGMYYDNIRVFRNAPQNDKLSYGVPQISTKLVKTFDFSTDNTSPYINSPGLDNSVAEIINLSDIQNATEEDRKHGRAAHLKTTGNTVKAALSAKDRTAFGNAPQSEHGAIIFDYDFKIIKADSLNVMLGALSYNNPANIEQIWGVLCFKPDGNLYVAQDMDHSGDTGVKVDGFSLNTWHNARYVIDTEKSVIYVFIDGVMYSAADCASSIYSGSSSRVLDAFNSRGNCYLEMQTQNPGVGKTIEYYVDNISLMYADSPNIYNLKYINNAVEISNISQITDSSELKVNLDVLSGNRKVIYFAALFDNTGRLCDSDLGVLDKSEHIQSARMILNRLPSDIAVSDGKYRVSVMLWNTGALKPLTDCIVFK